MNLITPDHSGPLRALAHHYRNELGLLAAVLAVIGLTCVLNDSYLVKPGYNAREILHEASLLGIFALGAGIVIIAGGIDLSSGSVIAFSGSVCVLVLMFMAPLDDAGRPITNDLPTHAFFIAFAAALSVGALVGTLHTWLITIVRLPPFVATLASLVGLRSLTRIMNQTITRDYFGEKKILISIKDPDFLFGRDGWWIPPAIFLVLSFLLWVLMNRTIVGRHLYAMGGNEEAARLSGIRTERIKWIAYTIGTMTAALAGILYTIKVGSADPSSQGRGYELNAIAAAVVGGCSLQGGIGLVPGIMLGALFLRVVIDAIGKVFLVGSTDIEGLIVGFLVVLAVAFNELRRHAGNVRMRFFPGLFGVLVIAILTLLTGTVLYATGGAKYGQVGAVVTLALLAAIKIFEDRRAAKA